MRSVVNLLVARFVSVILSFVLGLQFIYGAVVTSCVFMMKYQRTEGEITGERLFSSLPMLGIQIKTATHLQCSSNSSSRDIYKTRSPDMLTRHTQRERKKTTR